MPLFNKKKVEPETVSVQGYKLLCPLCTNDSFYKKKVQMNTSTLTALNLDFLNKSATCFVCSNCSRIEWFDA